MSESEQIAKALAETIMRVGRMGPKAERLVLHDKNKHEMAGWSEEPLAEFIGQFLAAALEHPAPSPPAKAGVDAVAKPAGTPSVGEVVSSEEVRGSNVDGIVRAFDVSLELRYGDRAEIAAEFIKKRLASAIDSAIAQDRAERPGRAMSDETILNVAHEWRFDQEVSPEMLIAIARAFGVPKP